MNFEFYKKFLIGIVLAGIVLNPSLLAVHEAKAVVPVTVPVFDIPAAGERATSFITKLSGMIFKKFVIDRFFDLSVEWIQKGGFEGGSGPIVEDWGAFFQQAGEDYIGEFANSVVPVLCGPFQANVALSLLQPKKFSTPVTCSLNNIVDNVDNFFKDFAAESKGRWLTYNAVWQPENNFYGSILATEDAHQKGTADLLNKKNIEATINLGFKPQQTCKTDAESGDKICTTVTPGRIIGDSVTQAVLPNFKSNAILSSDDIAGYVGALLDAVFYRYSLMAIGGAKAALSHTDKENTSTAYADANASAFSQINQISFQNTKALYLDEISSILATKRSTLTTLNEASSTQQDLINKLTPVANCPALELSFDQSSKISQAKNQIEDIKTSINNIGITINQAQNDINLILTAYDTINSLSGGEQTTDQANLTIGYTSLKSSGVLDAAKAATALSDAQTQLASIQQDAKIALENKSDATPSGYKDVISICTKT
jgi:hypothetical protein